MRSDMVKKGVARVSGGPMLAGRKNNKPLMLTLMFEAIGAVGAGKMSEAELAEMEEAEFLSGACIIQQVTG